MSEAAAAQAGTDQSSVDTTQTTQDTPQAAPQATNDSPWYGEVTAEDKHYLESKAWTGKDAPQKIFQSYKNAEKLISQIKGDPDRILVYPKDPNNKEEVSAFYEKLGVPKDIKDYGLPIENDDQRALAEVFQSKGVSKEAAAEIVRVSTEQSKINGERAAQEAEAKWEKDTVDGFNEWKKGAGSKADELVQAAKSAYKALPKFQESSKAIERAIGTKAYMEFAAELGSKIGEASPAGANPSGAQSGSMSKESAAQAARLLLADPQKSQALRDPDNLAHRAVREELQRLNQIAYSN